MKHLTLLTLLVLAAPLGWGDSQSANEKQVDVSVYSPPVPTKKINPKYPARARARGIEGWVQLHYMVDPSGNTYDIEIVDSNGDRSIERAAIKAARKYKYQPAEYQGEPIDASASTLITFAMADSGKIWSQQFAALFNKLANALQSNDLAEAESLISKLEKVEVTTLYEGALDGFIKGAYAAAKGDYEGVRRAYSGALALNKGEGFLTDGQVSGIMLGLMQAEMATGHLRAAIETWSSLKTKLTDEQLLKKLETQIAEIESLMASDGATSVRGTIAGGYSFFYKLSKKSFALSKVDGRLAEVKLFCEKGSVAFPVTEDIIYNVKKDLGKCSMYVVGDPAASFEIIDGA